MVIIYETTSLQVVYHSYSDNFLQYCTWCAFHVHVHMYVYVCVFVYIWYMYCITNIRYRNRAHACGVPFCYKFSKFLIELNTLFLPWSHKLVIYHTYHYRNVFTSICVFISNVQPLVLPVNGTKKSTLPTFWTFTYIIYMHLIIMHILLWLSNECLANPLSLPS